MMRRVTTSSSSSSSAVARTIILLPSWQQQQIRMKWSPGMNPYLSPEEREQEFSQYHEEKNKKSNGLGEEESRRVMVLYSSYDLGKSETAELDVHACTPSYWLPPKEVTGLQLIDIPVAKRDVEKTIKDLATAGVTEEMAKKIAKMKGREEVEELPPATSSATSSSEAHQNAANASTTSDKTATGPSVSPTSATVEVCPPPEAFINLCDGAFYEDRAGANANRTCDQEEIAWSGPHSGTYEIGKPDMKLLLAGTGVKCPGAVAFNTQPLSASDTPEAIAKNKEIISSKTSTLEYPLLIKPPAGLASIGMRASSRCNSLEELEAELRWMAVQGKAGAAHAATGVSNFTMIEEFIIGREATVLVSEKWMQQETTENMSNNSADCGVHAFPPVLLHLPSQDSFLHFDLKWDQETALMGRARRMDDPTSSLCGEHHDPQTMEKMQNAAKTAFKRIMGGQSYARCDFRIRASDNQPYFLEINPSCGMYYPWDGAESNCPPNLDNEVKEKEKHWMHGDLADMAILMDKDYSHLDLVEWQLTGAHQRKRESEPWWINTATSIEDDAAVTVRPVKSGQPLFGAFANPGFVAEYSSGLVAPPTSTHPTSTKSKKKAGVRLFFRSDGTMARQMARIQETKTKKMMNVGWLEHPRTGVKFIGALRDIQEGEKLCINATTSSS